MALLPRQCNPPNAPLTITLVYIKRVTITPVYIRGSIPTMSCFTPAHHRHFLPIHTLCTHLKHALTFATVNPGTQPSLCFVYLKPQTSTTFVPGLISLAKEPFLGNGLPVSATGIHTRKADHTLYTTASLSDLTHTQQRSW